MGEPPDEGEYRIFAREDEQNGFWRVSSRPVTSCRVVQGSEYHIQPENVSQGKEGCHKLEENLYCATVDYYTKLYTSTTENQTGNTILGRYLRI